MTRPAAACSIKATRLLLLVLLLMAGCGQQDVNSTGAQAVTLRVAVAANMQFAFEDLIAEFRQRHPSIHIEATYGSSGTFFAQLTNRAPFDMFFSADVEYPKRLFGEGLTTTDGMFEYASGRIVVWVPNDSMIDIESHGIQALSHPSVRRIAIANPQHAPYGRAAIEAMQHAGIHDVVAERLVLGENIAQAAQFVESGAADIGIIAMSLALAPAMKDKGRFWVVPAESYTQLRQGAVVLAWCARMDAASDLRDFVLGPAGQAILMRYGFTSYGA